MRFRLLSTWLAYGASSGFPESAHCNHTGSLKHKGWEERGYKLGCYQMAFMDWCWIWKWGRSRSQGMWTLMVRVSLRAWDATSHSHGRQLHCRPVHAGTTHQVGGSCYHCQKLIDQLTKMWISLKVKNGKSYIQNKREFIPEEMNRKSAEGMLFVTLLHLPEVGN